MKWKGYNGIYNRYVKRFLDIVLSLLAIICFSWLYVILGIAVRIKLGSPVFYTPKRPGRIDPKTGKETVFKLYKFRSMSDARDEQGNLLPDTERLTKFGRILRASSLDEIPEAFNILRGDMSIIGPRPLGLGYLPYYNEKEHHRHDVRPGLSGWAQVHGRNALKWEDRFAYDLEYRENVSLLLDLKIIVMTVLKVVKHEGIAQGEQKPESFITIRKKQWEAGNNAKAD